MLLGSADEGDDMHLRTQPSRWQQSSCKLQSRDNHPFPLCSIKQTSGLLFCCATSLCYAGSSGSSKHHVLVQKEVLLSPLQHSAWRDDIGVPSDSCEDSDAVDLRGGKASTAARVLLHTCSAYRR